MRKVADYILPLVLIVLCAYIISDTAYVRLIGQTNSGDDYTFTAQESDSDNASASRSSASASWTSSEYFSNVESMGSASEFIISGHVVDSFTEMRGSLVFTHFQIYADEIYKGEAKNGDVFDLLITGGNYGDYHTAYAEDLPELKVDTEYLLFLYKTPYDERYGEYYLVRGGFRGIAEISEEGYIPLAESNASFAKNFSEYIDKLE